MALSLSRLAASLEDLLVTKCFSLTTVNLSDLKSRFIRLAIIKCPRFSSISFSRETPPLLQFIDVSHTAIDIVNVELLFGHCRSLRTFRAQHCRSIKGLLSVKNCLRLFLLDLRCCSNLRGLEVFGGFVKHLFLNHCTVLESLRVQSPSIKELDCSFLLNLKKLQLTCTFLTHLDVSGCNSFATATSSISFFSTRDAAGAVKVGGGSARGWNKFNNDDNGNDDSDDGVEREGGGLNREYALTTLKSIKLGCPSLDWRHFLRRRTGGSGLFVLHDFDKLLRRADIDDARLLVTPPISPKSTSLSSSANKGTEIGGNVMRRRKGRGRSESL